MSYTIAQKLFELAGVDRGTCAIVVGTGQVGSGSDNDRVGEHVKSPNARKVIGAPCQVRRVSVSGKQARNNGWLRRRPIRTSRMRHPFSAMPPSDWMT